MNKILIVILALMMVGKVSAHVTVQPNEVKAGYSVSMIRVPNEKEVATTQVRVLLPDGVDVHGIMPLPGWDYAMTHEASDGGVEHEDGHGGQGRVTEVTWTGGKIGVGEFMEFPLSVQYSADLDKITWKAYQTYADGEVVPWDGSDEKHPAPTVTVLKDMNGPTVPVVSKDSWMNVGALLLSFAAFAISLKKKV